MPRAPHPDQPILTPDGMVHHPAPVYRFPRLAHWLELRRHGPGARSIAPDELAARRSAICEYCEDPTPFDICAQCRTDLDLPSCR
jgi:hypothetical protein